MFEDLIGKKVVNKIVEIFDIQNQCPHCKTDNITKRMISVLWPSKTMSKSQQPAYCSKCRKSWYIIRYKDENKKENTHIQHMSKKSGAGN
jgi:ribosomal protein L37AE/L43A